MSRRYAVPLPCLPCAQTSELRWASPFVVVRANSPQPFPPPSAPATQQWWRVSGQQLAPACTSNTPTSQGYLLSGNYPVANFPWLYLNLGTNNGYVTGSEQPQITETLNVSLPRDLHVYTVTVPIGSSTFVPSDTYIPLKQPYQPTAGDVVTFSFLSLNHSPYGTLLLAADALTFGNYTGVYPHGLPFNL